MILKGNEAILQACDSGIVEIPYGIEFVSKETTLPKLRTDRVDLPRTVIRIRKDTFAHSGLKKINLEYVRFIEKYAFAYCNLTDIDLQHIKTIGIYAFDHNDNLINIRIGEELREVNEGVFRFAKPTSIDLKNVDVIQSKAFFECKYLENVYMKKATFIGSQAFCKCKELQYVECPMLQKSGDECFKCCEKLKLLSIWNSCECTGLLLGASNIEKLIITDSNACMPLFVTNEKLYILEDAEGKQKTVFSFTNVLGDNRVAFQRYRYSEKIFGGTVIAIESASGNLAEDGERCFLYKKISSFPFYEEILKSDNLQLAIETPF